MPNSSETPRVDRETLEGLLARVRAATGPDETLDADLYLGLGIYTRHNRLAEWPDQAPMWAYHDSIRNLTAAHHPMVRPLTASLDAAVALVERVLPDLYRVTRFDPRLVSGMAFHCALQRLHLPGTGAAQWTAEAYAPTEPLAILAALLSALLAQHEPTDV